MQLLDPTLLISLIGLPSKHLKRALNKELDVYSRATCNEGLLCIRKYWDAHCSTISKLPAIALLDQSSCPRGISDTDFLALLSRLTSLQQWQIWDLRNTLDIHSCGFVGCQEFTLMIVLMCAAVAGQQMQAVHAYHSSICRVFAGAHAGSALAGLTQCCLLMQLPLGCLVAAVRQLQVNLSRAVAGFSSSKSSSGGHCCGGKAAVTAGKPSSSSCCPCSSCSCRHLGGVQTSWQEPGSSARSHRSCLCSTKASAGGLNQPADSSSRSASGSGRCSRSSSVLEPGSPQIGGCEAAAAVAVVRTAGVCKCLQGQSGWQGPTDKDVQLVLFTTVQLAHGMLLPYETSDSAAKCKAIEEPERGSTLGFCCIGRIV